MVSHYFTSRQFRSLKQLIKISIDLEDAQAALLYLKEMLIFINEHPSMNSYYVDRSLVRLFTLGKSIFAGHLDPTLYSTYSLARTRYLIDTSYYFLGVNSFVKAYETIVQLEESKLPEASLLEFYLCQARVYDALMDDSQIDEIYRKGLRLKSTGFTDELLDIRLMKALKLARCHRWDAALKDFMGIYNETKVPKKKEQVGRYAALGMLYKEGKTTIPGNEDLIELFKAYKERDYQNFRKVVIDDEIIESLVEFMAFELVLSYIHEETTFSRFKESLNFTALEAWDWINRFILAGKLTASVDMSKEELRVRHVNCLWPEISLRDLGY